MSGNNKNKILSKKNKKVFSYLLVILIMAITSLIFSRYFDPYNKFKKLTSAYQSWNLDETLFIFFSLTLASTWLVFRRTREKEGEAYMRRLTEGELHVAYKDLRSSYEALKLAQEKAIASEKLASVGLLAAGVSHEILNPLSVITVRLEMLINDPNTPEEMASHLRNLAEQANRITKITMQLLHFARQRPPDLSSLDLNETIKNTLALVVNDMLLEKISVELRLDESLPPLKASQDQFQQVVFNLLINARDAIVKGGRIVLSTCSFRENGRRFAELKVEDTGVGISPKHMNKIFDPFFTTKPEGRGTGLGLSICRGIVEAHAGSIQAESVKGQGTTFIVKLPLEPAYEAGPV